MTEARWRAVIAFSLLAIMPCMMTFSKNLGSGGFISGFLFCVTRPGVILVVNGEVNEAGIKRRGDLVIRSWSCVTNEMLYVVFVAML
jgi:hypothetical protein